MDADELRIRNGMKGKEKELVLSSEVGGYGMQGSGEVKIGGIWGNADMGPDATWLLQDGN